MAAVLPLSAGAWEDRGRCKAYTRPIITKPETMMGMNGANTTPVASQAAPPTTEPIRGQVEEMVKLKELKNGIWD